LNGYKKNRVLQIKPIDISHAALLSSLAKDIYREYYLHLWLPGGADWYMHEHAYPENKILAELSNKENLHYIVWDENEPLGYLKLKLQASLEGCEGLPALEIERIYLHRKAAGKGTGKQLMLFSEEIARQHNKQLLFLKAMDSSVDALAFYHKMGYTDHGRLTLPFPLLKEEFRGMIILRKDLG
jgi:GNAT superfamily N-acetyltransferase